MFFTGFGSLEQMEKQVEGEQASELEKRRDEKGGERRGEEGRGIKSLFSQNQKTPVNFSKEAMPSQSAEGVPGAQETVPPNATRM